MIDYHRDFEYLCLYENHSYVIIIPNLAKTQQRTEQRVEELAESQQHTEHALQQLTRQMGGLARQVGGMSDRMGGDLEEVAAIMIHDVLEREFGWQIDELDRAWQIMNSITGQSKREIVATFHRT